MLLPSFARSAAHAARRRSLLALGVLAVATACDDDPTGPRQEPEPEPNTRRLLVTDQATATARLVDVDDAAVLLTVPLGEVVGTVYASGSRRFGFLHERTTNRVTIVDGGVWGEDHGDHAHVHRATPRVSPVSLTGALPTHGTVHGSSIAVFFDGDGSAAFLDEADLAAGTLNSTVVPSGTAHHGLAFRFGGAYFLSNPTRTGMNRHAASGLVEQGFAGCPGLHGDAVNAVAGAVGCSDGVLLIRQQGGAFTGVKVPTTGELAGFGVGYLNGRDDYGFFIARAQQAGTRRLVRLDPAAGTLTPIALGGGYPLAWDVTHGGRHLVVVDDAGTVRIVDMVSLQTVGTIANVVAAIPASEYAAAPTLVAAEHEAYVSSPKTGELLVLDLEEGRVSKRIPVGGAPGKLALLGVAFEVVEHDH